MTDALDLAGQVADEAWQLVGPCTKCGRMLPRDAFHNARREKSGRQTWCKECHRAFYDNAEPTVLEKRCADCGETKPASAFQQVRRTKDGLHQNCRECKRWNDKARLYGITREQYHALWEGQDGKCALCPVELESLKQKSVHIDHDHETSIVRGILCQPCNIAVGQYELLRKHNSTADIDAYLARGRE